MKQVSLRELHEKTGALIRSAKRLGGLVVTDRGAPIARIEPVDSRPAPNPFLSRKVLPAYQRLFRSGRLGRGPDSTQIVSDDRDSR
jgi:antitoxin (DNA-binding transcriptional repressor) of toxin-antitoxin stability system